MNGHNVSVIKIQRCTLNIQVAQIGVSTNFFSLTPLNLSEAVLNFLHYKNRVFNVIINRSRKDYYLHCMLKSIG